MFTPIKSLARVLAVVSLVLGCADQAAGERCDVRNGNQDCAPGLVCEGTKQSAVCCPKGSAADQPRACVGANVSNFSDGGTSSGGGATSAGGASSGGGATSTGGTPSGGTPSTGGADAASPDASADAAADGG